MEKIIDDKLGSVTGGAGNNENSTKNTGNSGDTRPAYCPKCETEREFRLGSGGRAYCKVCNEEIMM